MNDIKDSRHHCGKLRDKRRRASRCGHKSPMMSEKSEADLTSSAASSPALGPAASPTQSGTRRPPLPPPPPDEALPRATALLPQQLSYAAALDASVFRLAYPTRQVYPTHGVESQDRLPYLPPPVVPPVPMVVQERPSPSERLQCDASKQACLKETDNSAAVTRLDVAMSRLRKIYFGILEEQLLNEALLAAGSDGDEPTATRGGSVYCCGDRLSPPAPSTTTTYVSAEGGGGGGSSDLCAYCGAPAGHHHRVTQTSASDRALLLDAHLLPRLMHAYERNHALIVQDLREALARVEEAAGVGVLEAEAAMRSTKTQQQQPQPTPSQQQQQTKKTTTTMTLLQQQQQQQQQTQQTQMPQQQQQQQQQQAPMQPLPSRPDVCPKECSPARCPLVHDNSSATTASPVLTHRKQSRPQSSSSKDPQAKRGRRHRPSWWRRLLCIS